MSLAAESYWWLVHHQKPPLPPPPTRLEAISFNGSMQALQVQTSYGLTPIWEGPIAWFPPADRQLIYAAKRAKGDTHCGAQLSGAYTEPNQFYQQFPGKDWTQDLPGFLSLLIEIIEAGFKPWVPLAGDGLVYDPGGLTYGWFWLMQNLPHILEALKPVEPYTLYSPGYDGIIAYDETTQSFGPWSLDQLDRFLILFRQLAPTGYLSLEPSAGPLGGVLPDFLSPAAYDALDCYLNELDSPPNNSVTWESADRLLGPAFIRPPDMPPTEDPDAPFGPNSPKWRLRTPTSRGMPVACGFEICTYGAVRGMPIAEQQRQVQYVKNNGYSCMG